MSDTKPAEPSMEEILASIRQIINQNDSPADDTAETPMLAGSDADAIDNAPEDDDVLELTTILEDELVMDGPEPVTMAAEPEPVYTPPPVRKPAPSSAADLISGDAEAAATSSLYSLAATLQQERAEHSLPLGNTSRTLESMVVEAMRPLLKEWLDSNLPALVERVVQQEVEKLTRRLGA